MISHSHKIIFVHINKTAGTSIHKILEKMQTPCPGKHHTIEKYHKLADENHGFENYFKFTFVRNSWDRFLSLYKYRVKTEHPTLAGNPLSFKEWVKNIYNKNPKYYKVNGPYMQRFMLSEQLDWITDANGSINIDFIGRFEKIQDDFNIVCDKIGIPRQELPHKNKTEHKHYTEYYDDETRELAAEKYKKDIEYFGYEFGE